MKQEHKDAVEQERDIRFPKAEPPDEYDRDGWEAWLERMGERGGFDSGADFGYHLRDEEVKELKEAGRYQKMLIDNMLTESDLVKQQRELIEKLYSRVQELSSKEEEKLAFENMQLQQEIERLKGLIEDAWKHGFSYAVDDVCERLKEDPMSVEMFKQKHGL